MNPNAALSAGISTASVLLGIAVMAVVTYLMRMLPLVLFRRRIRSVWLRSFLAYLPYAVLAAMTVPAAFFAGGSLPATLAGLAVAGVMSWFRMGLFPVAAAASTVACLISLIPGIS